RLSGRGEVIVSPPYLYCDSAKALQVNVVESGKPKTGVEGRAGIEEKSVFAGISRGAYYPKTGKQDVGGGSIVCLWDNKHWVVSVDGCESGAVTPQTKAASGATICAARCAH